MLLAWRGAWRNAEKRTAGICARVAYRKEKASDAIRSISINNQRSNGAKQNIAGHEKTRKRNISGISDNRRKIVALSSKQAQAIKCHLLDAETGHLVNNCGVDMDILSCGVQKLQEKRMLTGSGMRRAGAGDKSSILSISYNQAHLARHHGMAAASANGLCAAPWRRRQRRDRTNGGGDEQTYGLSMAEEMAYNGNVRRGAWHAGRRETANIALISRAIGAKRTCGDKCGDNKRWRGVMAGALRSAPKTHHIAAFVWWRQ